MAFDPNKIPEALRQAYGAGRCAVLVGAGASKGAGLPLWGELLNKMIDSAVAHKVITPDTPYVDLKYRQALALSTTYQAGIVSWVAFWALYGEGFAGQTISNILTFGAAYMTVIIIEPLADLGVLAAAKGLRQLRDSPIVERRLFNPA